MSRIIYDSTSIIYLHYDCYGESVYLKVSPVQQKCTVVSISGRNGKKGRYCRGVYNIKWTTFCGTYGGYDKYWSGPCKYTKTICNERIGYFLKVTTKNQYEKAKADVLNSLI